MDSTNTSLHATISIFEKLGFFKREKNKKLSRFEGGEGVTVYLKNENLSDTKIQLYLDPRIERSKILMLNGVEKVSEECSFHSNMTAFPKRLNKGRKATTFGWLLTCNSLYEFERFLIAFKKLA